MLVEERARLGRGVAYSTTSDAHLLNVPAAGMSAFPDEPGHFLQWARARRPEIHAVLFSLPQQILDVPGLVWLPQTAHDLESLLPVVLGRREAHRRQAVGDHFVAMATNASASFFIVACARASTASRGSPCAMDEVGCKISPLR